MREILQIVFFSTMTILVSCSQSNVDKYNAIIDKTTRIEVQYKDSGKNLELSHEQVDNFKATLKRNIEPVFPRKFISDIQINLYEDNNRIGFLMITENESKPFVNFSSKNISFGFQLTYGIGMYLNENK